MEKQMEEQTACGALSLNCGPLRRKMVPYQQEYAIALQIANLINTALEQSPDLNTCKIRQFCETMLEYC